MQWFTLFCLINNPKMKALESFWNIHDSFIVMSEDLPPLHRHVIYEFSQCGKMVYPYLTHKEGRVNAEA